MARILLLFASSYGHTRDIAWTIERVLRRRGHAVDLIDSRRAAPSPAEYDAVVIGSRVQFGRHAAAIRRYVKRHRDELVGVPTAFFSVSMSTVDPDPEPYLQRFIDQTGWKPSRSIELAGGLAYRHYNPLLRLVMKRIARKAGHSTDTARDHDFTDWGAVRQFAGAIADDVTRAAGAQSLRSLTTPVQAVRSGDAGAPAAGPRDPARPVL
jgi:menaquinone-dependent protoporphyrinogen oxidase